jgi:hypothetical protein
MESYVQPTFDTATYSRKLKKPLQTEGKQGSGSKLITYATLP